MLSPNYREVMKMAKYTMILGECLNLMTGRQYNIYNVLDISPLVQASKRSVFMSFPIWDEAYRPILESKILTHYLYREIGFESMAMFIFMLNRKLNEIMPYYNEMYKTLLPDLLKEDWFDYFEDYLGGMERNEAGEGKEGEASQSITKTDRVNKNIDITDKSSTRTPNLNETEDRLSADASITETDRIYDNFSASQNESTGDSGITYGKIDSTKGDGKTETNYGKIEKKTGKDETALIGKRTDRFSDTPQGSLRNIENNTYLTNANINDVNDKTTVTYGSIITNDGKDTVEHHNTGTSTLSGKDTADSHSNDEAINLSIDVSSDKATDNRAGYNLKEKRSTGSETTDDNGNVMSFDETEEVSGTETVGGKETSDKKNTKENSVYTKHIHGKNPSNYVETIMEWREGIINIDMMVIEELEVLFMAMY